MTERRKLAIKELSILAAQILTIFALLAGVGKVFVIAKMVDDNQADLMALKPMVSNHTTQIAVIDARLTEIQRGIDSIGGKLDRMDRWNKRRDQ